MGDDKPDLAHRLVMAMLAVVSNEELSAVNELLRTGELRPLLRAVNDAASLIETHKPNGHARRIPGVDGAVMRAADETAERTEH